jgi:hypothetical protein
MDKEVLCDSCNQPMEMVERLSNGKNRRGHSYRRRRFHCYICDIYHMEYADGQSQDNYDRKTLELAQEEYSVCEHRPKNIFQLGLLLRVECTKCGFDMTHMVRKDIVK